MKVERFEATYALSISLILDLLFVLQNKFSLRRSSNTVALSGILPRKNADLVEAVREANMVIHVMKAKDNRTAGSNTE